jgi:MFS family permease
LGKGIRGAPRDALIADWTRPDMLGYAFGVRQGLDTVGAVIGPALAILLLGLYPGNYSVILWWAVLPAIASVAVIGLGVEDAPETKARQGAASAILTRAMVERLGTRFWIAMALLTPLLAARTTEAFLILRATSLGVPLQWAPLALVALNLVAAPVTPVAGWLSDKFGRRRLILLGFIVLMAAHGLLSLATEPLHVWFAAALWGVHLGMTQGVFSALVADRAPSDLRGTAFGVFHLASGIAVFVGSALMGWGWDGLGPSISHALAAASILVFLPLFIRAAGR